MLTKTGELLSYLEHFDMDCVVWGISFVCHYSLRFNCELMTLTLKFFVYIVFFPSQVHWQGRIQDLGEKKETQKGNLRPSIFFLLFMQYFHFLGEPSVKADHSFFSLCLSYGMLLPCLGANIS